MESKPNKEAFARFEQNAVGPIEPGFAGLLKCIKEWCDLDRVYLLDPALCVIGPAEYGPSDELQSLKDFLHEHHSELQDGYNFSFTRMDWTGRIALVDPPSSFKVDWGVAGVLAFASDHYKLSQGFQTRARIILEEWTGLRSLSSSFGSVDTATSFREVWLLVKSHPTYVRFTEKSPPQLFLAPRILFDAYRSQAHLARSEGSMAAPGNEPLSALSAFVDESPDQGPRGAEWRAALAAYLDACMAAGADSKEIASGDHFLRWGVWPLLQRMNNPLLGANPQERDAAFDRFFQRVAGLVEPCQPATPPHGEPGTVAGPDRMRAIYTLSVAWRALRFALKQTRTDKEWTESISQAAVRDLIGKTLDACSWFLDGSRVKVGNAEDLRRVDADFLLVYLLSRFLSSDGLAAYYGLGEPKSDDAAVKKHLDRLRKWKKSPREGRAFLEHLCVVVLHGCFRIERCWDPDFERRFVDADPAASISAILYLLDRYAILEFNLDERMNIFRHLREAYAIDTILYFTKAWYREHVYHVVEVYALGLLLLDCDLGEGAGGNTLLDWMAKRAGGTPEAHRSVLQNWTLAALFHDVGYGLEAVEAACPLIERMQSEPASRYKERIRMGRTEATRAFFEAFKSWQVATPKSMEKMSSRLPPHAHWKDRTELDHGVSSYCHLLHILAEIDRHADYLRDGDADRKRTSSMVDRFVPALVAICDHHAPDRQVKFETQPMSFLLALVDEIQDWGRPRVKKEDMALGLGASWRLQLPSPRPDEGLVDYLFMRLEAAAADRYPRFRFPVGGPSFHLVFHPGGLPGDPVLTTVVKASNFQRLHQAVPLWGGKAGRLVVSCLFPRTSGGRAPTELEVYRRAAEICASLPYLEAFNYNQDAMNGRADAPVFGYAEPEPLAIQFPDKQHRLGGQEPVLHAEVFCFDITKLGLRAQPSKGHNPRPLFPGNPDDHVRAVLKVRAEMFRSDVLS